MPLVDSIALTEMVKVIANCMKRALITAEAVVITKKRKERRKTIWQMMDGSSVISVVRLKKF